MEGGGGGEEGRENDDAWSAAVEDLQKQGYILSL